MTSGNSPAADKPASPKAPALINNILDGLKLVDEIDTGTVDPVFESAPGVAKIEDVLGRKARVMTVGEEAGAFAYVIGKDKGLEAGKAYVLAVEYPDDLPRTFYLANRGADYTRGWATGTAAGDTRGQFAEPSLESMNYPQSGQWQVHKQFFFLLNKFQGVESVRDPKPGCRPHLPAEGFTVAFFQTKKLNDPRNTGVALGRIRLYEVPDPEALFAPINYAPAKYPKRRVFWREEMADQIIQTNDPETQAVSDSVDWYVHKMKMAKILGINTFSKDLLEFGFNQGWETGDEEWVLNAQPPNKDLWTRLVPAAAAQGLEILPYYEYKTAIGNGNSLAKQRRAHKLYHDIKKTCDNPHMYTCVWWTEGHNGDVTDPDTLADAKKLLDKTIVEFKDKAKFAGAWFRTRASHLPMSFAPAAIDRFKADNKTDADSQTASQQTLIASYEGDQVLYSKYVKWWFTKRAQFLTSLQKYLSEKLGNPDMQVLFTPWTGEAVPVVHGIESYFNHPGVVTDDPDWWKTYADSLGEGYWKYHWMPSPYDRVVSEKWYAGVLREQPPITHGMNSNFQEEFHAAPYADPENFKNVEGVMMTYPIGRLFTVADGEAMETFRAKSGLTVAKHYALNEESEVKGTEPSPFGHFLGYISVDCDRAGNYLMLQQARAVAYGDPRNIVYLSGSSFSTGFPEIMRRFHLAFLAVPALPSSRLDNASSDPEVVVREIKTADAGVYYYVVNTSMQPKADVGVKLPIPGKVTNQVTGQPESSNSFKVSLDPAELRAYRVR